MQKLAAIIAFVSSVAALKVDVIDGSGTDHSLVHCMTSRSSVSTFSEFSSSLLYPRNDEHFVPCTAISQDLFHRPTQVQFIALDGVFSISRSQNDLCTEIDIYSSSLIDASADLSDKNVLMRQLDEDLNQEHLDALARLVHDHSSEMLVESLYSMPISSTAAGKSFLNELSGLYHELSSASSSSMVLPSYRSVQRDPSASSLINLVLNSVDTSDDALLIVLSQSEKTTFYPRALATDNTTSNTTIEQKIANYQIALWVSIGLALTLLTAVLMFCCMEVNPDNILMAKFQTSRGKQD